MEDIFSQFGDSFVGGSPFDSFFGGGRSRVLKGSNLRIKLRLNLEEIANGFPGVEKTFAIQAGREIRIVVSPEEVGDEQALEMSEKIARKVEEELQYPGQIKVVVIRETRAVDYAR